MLIFMSTVHVQVLIKRSGFVLMLTFMSFVHVVSISCEMHQGLMLIFVHQSTER